MKNGGGNRLTVDVAEGEESWLQVLEFAWRRKGCCYAVGSCTPVGGTPTR